MSRNRTETWLALIVVGIGLIPVAIMGLWAYMSATATPLHPNPKDAPSVIHSTPPPRWADAVEQGRQIVRLGLTDQNLPGLSVAVGVGGDIVWAEGFGWADLEKRVPVAPEMKFRIGTASTAITSAAVGLLLEEGRLDLDEDIQTYVPEFPQKQRPVTLRQLMAHVAGAPNDGGDEGPTDYSCWAGASLFLSTPSDLVRFDMAINGGTLLQPATVQLLQASQRLSSGEETGYGLGWDIENVTLADEHTRWVGHDGTSFGGTVASLMTLPERGIVVAVTSNISYTDTEALALKIAQAFAEHASSK